MNFNSLLPPDLALARETVAVADSLLIPAHPELMQHRGIGQLQTTEDVTSLSRVLYELPVDNTDQRLMVNDKSQPHAVHDLMMISGGDQIIPNLYDHSDGFVNGALMTAGKFAVSCADTELLPVVSWSYDPDTFDRPSGQGEKRFHAHMVGRSTEEIDIVQAIKQPLGELSSFRQRRIADEFSAVAAFVLYDLLESEDLSGIQLVEPFTTEQSKLSLQFIIDDGWEGLAINPEPVAKSLAQIDRTYRNSFDELTGGLTTGAYDLWERPELAGDASDLALEVANEAGLSSNTARILSYFVTQLHPELIDSHRGLYFEHYADSALTTHLYPLAGPSYTTCITEVDGELKGHIRGNMFTDLGGAGVALVDGTMTKVKKTRNPMTSTQYSSRRDFQENVVSSVA